MAAVKGVVATAVAAGGLSNASLNGLRDGRVKAMLDTYVVAGTETVASTITLGAIIPTGANIIAIILSVEDAQAAATFSVGDAGSATRYASAHTGLQTADTAVIIRGKNYVVTGTDDDQIVLTTGGATLTASSGGINICVLYTLD